MSNVAHNIEYAVLTIINDGDGSLCGLTYKQRCELSEYGLAAYCTAVARVSPKLSRRQQRVAAEEIQTYYRDHVEEVKQYEAQKGTRP